MNLPANLVFFVSNLTSIITVRLDQTNYMVWQLQVKNALRANQLLEYVDGSKLQPPERITNDTGNVIENSEYLEWINVDRQLVSCLNAIVKG